MVETFSTPNPILEYLQVGDLIPEVGTLLYLVPTSGMPH